MHPAEIRLDGSRTRLSITWENGATSNYSVALLREQARDASSVRMSISGLAVPAASDLKITRIEPVGNYAIRLAFSDGHDRGIFPWRYLTEIAASEPRLSVDVMCR